ncbi:hypothetical protein [Neptuniibacter caesariensis]|uniref:DUF4129 domain-containing protein n=1 Tax=Neptuniibacter caesariensis TaxID=207954 RepID=A0A7U8C491_NEPCE|nr:hypothetical protein [Neptuniibacter caesariensis]EAR61230.1 hypothetical protein MED92_10904 [Oceanospirillum sp. MED92] [Neptuniibacter caesariensis]
MNLTDLQFNAKLRTQWQAIDLGTVIAKKWYKPLFFAWMIPALILFIACHLFFYDNPSISLLIVWWFKPLFDRLPLILLSRYIFNENPFTGLSKKSLLKLCMFDLLSALTWRRFEFKRSFNLAVSMLEQQKGKARRQRCNLLQFGCGNAAGWLTVTLVHMELLLSLSIIALIAMFIPSQLDLKLFEAFIDNPLYYEHAYNALYFCCFCLVAPFYIACGFSLYLNRRIELEAWDIELIFRHSMEKREAKKATTHGFNSAKRNISASIALILSLFFCAPYDSVYAEGAQAEAVQSKEAIQHILESPPFVIEKKVTAWEFKNDGDAPDDSEEIDFGKFFENAQWLEELVTNTALLFEILIWLLITFILFIVAKSVINTVNFAPLNTSQKKTFDAPEVIMGLSVTKESLPDDIRAAVQESLRLNDFREALSLLYRYSLFTLIQQHGTPLEYFHTEKECADLVKHNVSEDISAIFSELTLAWQLQAYAHRSATQEEINHLLNKTMEVLNNE